MHTGSILEIPCDNVTKIHITGTIIPENFREYDGNKTGVLADPVAVCYGPNASLLIS